MSILAPVVVSLLILSKATSAQTISVANVEELYTAVNNTANAGATLVLAPGTYTLSATDPLDAARPNGGRLELQEDMSLIGIDGDRSAVTIDAVNLPASSYVGVGHNVAAVNMGRGRNSIAWITVRNARNGPANVDTNLRSAGTAYVMIAHVALSGGGRGLDVQSFGAPASGGTLEADIVDSDFFNNSLNQFSQGVRIVNAQTSNSVINVRMTGNRSWGQQNGRLLANNSATNCTINAFSAGNRFFGNASGTNIFGAFAGTTANGNTINFEAHGDQFVDNTSINTYFGGLIVVGGENGTVANRVHNNNVNVSLWGCRMSGNNTWDLVGVGARSTPVSIGLPGTNNHVTIEIHGEGQDRGRWQPVELFADSIPNDPSLGNSVTVIR